MVVIIIPISLVRTLSYKVVFRVTQLIQGRTRI